MTTITEPHTTTQPEPAHPAQPRLDRITAQIRRRSFCTLATSSTTGRPHVSGVLYAADGHDLWIGTLRSSRKAHNIAANPEVFVCIPVRRLPVGPPSTIQFRATADLLGPDDPDLLRLVEAGRLKAITGHGELDLPDICFFRVRPHGRLLTFGLGLPLHRFLRDPLNASGMVELPS